MGTITNEDIFKFCITYDWQKKLNNLEEILLPERWSFIECRNNAKNTKNPILENYIKHTFIRLWQLCSRNVENENQYISCDEKSLCFNTGLFTQHYEKIYVLLKLLKEPKEGKLWALENFVKESDPRLYDLDFLPEKIPFIEKIDDLIFDTSLELRVNSSHILSDPDNVERLPNKIRNAPNLALIFDGAIKLAKNRIESNYKTAVPQFYNKEVQFLIPLSLQSYENVDLVLAVAKKKNTYAGRTCLTLDMAYNNARLIAKPETAWLVREYYETQ